MGNGPSKGFLCRSAAAIECQSPGNDANTILFAFQLLDFLVFYIFASSFAYISGTNFMDETFGLTSISSTIFMDAVKAVTI